MTNVSNFISNTIRLFSKVNQFRLEHGLYILHSKRFWDKIRQRLSVETTVRKHF